MRSGQHSSLSKHLANEGKVRGDLAVPDDDNLATHAVRLIPKVIPLAGQRKWPNFICSALVINPGFPLSSFSGWLPFP